MRVTEKRRQAERERRRRSIMRAAGRLWAKGGFRGTTMEDIAHAAQLGTATTYYYFKSKDELYVSLVIDALDSFIEELIAIDKSDLEPIDKVRRLWSFYYEYYEKYPAHYHGLFHLYRDELPKSLSKGVLEAIREKSAENFRLASHLIQACIDSGAYAARDPQAVGDMLWSMFMGIVHLAETRQNLGVEARGLKELHGLAFEWFEEGWRKR